MTVRVIVRSVGGSISAGVVTEIVVNHMFVHVVGHDPDMFMPYQHVGQAFHFFGIGSTVNLLEIQQLLSSA